MLTTLTTIRTYNCTNDKTTIQQFRDFLREVSIFFEINFLIGGIS